MAFGMGGGGVSRAINVFLKNDIFKNYLESFPDSQNLCST